MSGAEKITDHAKIKAWVEERDGKPAKVRTDDAEEGSGILRIEFQDRDDKLEPIEWDEFFKIFESNKLAMLEQDETSDGRQSRFAKFVSR